MNQSVKARWGTDRSVRPNELESGQPSAPPRDDSQPFAGSTANWDDCQLLPVRVRWQPLQVLNSGQLVPWLGPALRGLVLQPMRDQLCQLNDQERQERRAALPRPDTENYCLGCMKNASCQYGRVFEPDRLIIAGRVSKGMREGLRGVSIAPAFPVRCDASRGDSFLLRLMGIGSISAPMMELTTEAIDALGSTVGLGPSHVKVRLLRAEAQVRTWQLDHRTLPRTVTRDTVPWLKIVLETPLFLKGPSANGRRFTGRRQEPPTLAILLRESIRTVRRALDEYSNAQPMEFDPGELLQAAAATRQDQQDWEIFEQSRISARQQSRWQPSGWVGSVTYSDVPLALIPWLIWGGRLGIGDARNCGAGLWHTVLT